MLQSPWENGVGSLKKRPLARALCPYLVPVLSVRTLARTLGRTLCPYLAQGAERKE